MKTLLFMALIMTLPLSAEADGIWTRYPSADHPLQVLCSGDYVWYATSGGAIRRNRHDGSFVRYTVRDGLAGNTVRCIHIDRDGAVWFATDGGLTRWDGVAWTTWPAEEGFARDTISCMSEDWNGVMWFGSLSDGAYRFDGTTWRRFTKSDGLAGESVRRIAVDTNNVVWFAVGGSLSSFNGERWRTYTIDDGVPGEIRDMAADGTGAVWLAVGSILTSFDGVRFMRYRSNLSISIDSIAIDEENAIWLGTTSGLGRFANYQWEMLSTFPSPYWINYCKPIDIDDDGCIWSGLGDSHSFSYGIARFDGAEWTQYRTEDGPPTDAVMVAAVDAENRKWFGTWFQGLACFDGNSWSMPLSREESSYGYTSLLTDHEGTLWVSFDGRLASYSGNGWKIHTAEDGVPVRVDLMASGPDGAIWAITSEGLSRFDGINWVSFNDDILRSLGGISSIAVDRENTVWISSSNSGNTDFGLASFDGEIWREYTYLDGMQYDDIEAIAVDADNVKWFATHYGVMRHDGHTWNAFHAQDGLAGNSVTAIAVDRNNVKWFATDNGLSSFDGKTWQSYLTGSFSYNERVESIVVDHDNIKWFTGYFFGIASFDDRGPVGVEEISTYPSPFNIGNHPNPFNPSTTISFTLPEPGKTELTIYDITGRKVRELVSERLSAGKHSVVWDGRDGSGRAASSGVYFARLHCGDQVAAQRMVLVR